MTNKALTVLSIAVTIGIVVGFVISVDRIVANEYIQHKMFRLVALSLQRSLNKWILWSIGISVVLLIVIRCSAFAAKIIWKLLLSRMLEVNVRVTNKKMMKVLLVSLVCATWFFYGGWAINHYWLPNRFHPISLAGDVGVLLLTVLLGWALMKVEWDTVRKSAIINHVRKSVPILVVLVLALNLAVIVDNKVNVPRGPNVLWFLIDALRADHLGCYGYDKDTSPFMDRFADASVRFTQAFSQESYTQASVPSYFTSTYPPVHKVLYDHPGIDILDSRFVTLAEVLRNANYSTAAFVFNPHLKARFNFGQGFDVYDDNKKGFDYSLPFHETFETAGKIFEKVERYLKKNKRRPVFLYLHYRDVHDPYAPPPPYHKLFLPPSAAPVVDMIDKEKLPLKKEYVDLHISQYDGEIRYTDDYIERTLNMLEDHGISRDNSIIIITADHGEEFLDYHPGDPGGFFHGRTLYRELIHVPLIVSIPDVDAQRRIVDSYVELNDIVPTVLDVSNIPWREYHQFMGRSLLPIIRGEDTDSRPIYSGGNFGRGTIIEGAYKYYIYDKFGKEGRLTGVGRPPDDYQYRFVEELYNVTTDPEETRNVVNEHQDVASRLKQILASVQAGFPVDRESTTVTLDSTTKAQLKALGYLK